MEPDRGKSSIYGGESATMNLSCNFSSIQISRKRRRAVDEDENYCSHNSHSVRMLFSYPLVALTTCLILCFIPHPTHALPFDGNLLAGNSGSLSNSHRSHLDLLIDPIHQAEFGDEELESKKVVAKSVFDMVLRTPPPPTSSSTRCPPGTQSPFEGGPCITKSKEPVAVVDQLFLLDTLRGLTRDGVLLGGGSTRTRRPGGGGGHNRRRPSGKPKMPTTTTTTTTIKTTTQPPTTTITTEIPPETTLMLDVSDSGLEDVTQQPLSSFDMIPASVNTFRPAVAAFENPKFPEIISLDKVASAEDMNGKRIVDSESGINVEEVTFVPTPSTTVSDNDQEMTTLVTEIPTPLVKDDPESGFNNNGNQVAISTTLVKSQDSPAIESATEKNVISPQSVRVLPPVKDSSRISAEISSPEMQPTTSTNGHAIRERPNPLTVSNFTDATTTMKSASSVTFTMREPLGADIISQPISESEITVLEQSKEMAPSGAVEEMTDVTQNPSATTLSSDRNIASPTRVNANAFNHDDGEKGVESPITIKMMNMNNMEINPDQLQTDNFDGETDKLSTTYSSLAEKEVEEVEDVMLLLDPSKSPIPSSDTIIPASDREPSTEDESKFRNKAKVLIITGVDSAGGAEEQMMTTGDKNMTGAQPVSLVEKEQSGKVGDDHPSFTTAVNHLPISEIGLVEDQTENKDVKETVDFGSRDATSTVDDLVVVNNHTVSPAYHHPMAETKQQEQVLVNKDGEIADPPLKSSSSRERDGDQQVLPEIKSPELATTLIPPSTTVSSAFHPKDTLLQFQLPIVTRGPTASNNFQNFPEFPSGRIRFPQDTDTATGHYPGTTFRGTLRPLLSQDLQLDYPPKEFLRANHPSFNTDLEDNSAAKSASFKEQKPQEWQTLKPFPSATSVPTVDVPESSTASEYDNASTEYLESELDRRHQKTRSRNRMKSSEATTNQPVPPEFIQTFYPAASEIQQQSQQQRPPPTPPRQQFYYGRRNPSADLITFGYLNFRNGHDRTHHNTRRLVW